MPQEEGNRLPHNLEMEQAVLGAIFVNNDAYYAVADFLKAEHFFEPLHGRIFEISATLIADGKSAGPVSVRQFLIDDEAFRSIGGPPYLQRLITAAVTVLHTADYGRHVFDLALRRELIEICEFVSLAAAAPAPDEKAETIIADLEERVSAVNGVGASDRMTWTLGDSLRDVLDAHDRRQSGDDVRSFVPYGIKGLDDVLGGVRRGEYGLVAARPSMGKSAIMAQIALNAATAGYSLGIISADMGHGALSARMASSWLAAKGVHAPFAAALNGNLDMVARQAFDDAVGFVSGLSVYIDQKSNPTVAHVASRARDWQRRLRKDGKELDLLLVDHIHNMQGPKHTRQSRTMEIGSISNDLKALARELDVGLLALCQLNRGLDSRENKRPTLGDLRWAGELEQDARWAIFLHRPWFYEQHNEPKRGSFKSELAYQEALADFEAERSVKENLLEMIVEKNNNGPVGIVKGHYDKALNFITDEGGA